MKPYYESAGQTIYCGDCREILPQLKSINLTYFDPPYGVGRKYGPSYDDNPDIYWSWFIPCVQELRKIAPVMAMHHRLEALKRLHDWDWIICWYKPYGAGARIGNSPILPHWEPILLWGIHTLGAKRNSIPDVITANPEPSPSNIKLKTKGKIHFGHRKKAYEKDFEIVDHPLPKPLSVALKLISGLTSSGELVLDPFMGSGTTLRAAKDLGRKAIGIDIEEKYCEIAVNRLAQEVLL